MRVFEARTATRREHFVCLDPIVTQIFILLISNGETILSNLWMWLCEGKLNVKIAHFRSPSESQKRKLPSVSGQGSNLDPKTQTPTLVY